LIDRAPRSFSNSVKAAKVGAKQKAKDSGKKEKRVWDGAASSGKNLDYSSTDGKDQTNSSNSLHLVIKNPLTL
jgi:hypothetical protein